MFGVRSGVLQLFVLVGLIVASGIAAPAEEPAPVGWTKAGSRPNDYAMTIDRAEKHGGAASATVCCTTDLAAEGFGTLLQRFSAKPYCGKRLRVTGFAKTKEVENQALLWVRVDGLDKNGIAFDNMRDRPIKGSTDWAKYAIVLDVPQEAAVISFGVLVVGRGQAWLDDVKVEAAGQDVEVTAPAHEGHEYSDEDKAKMQETLKNLPKEPSNLDFEK